MEHEGQKQGGERERCRALLHSALHRLVVQGGVDQLGELLSDDAVLHHLQPIRGAQEILAVAKRLLVAIDERELELVRSIAGDQRVTTQFHLRGRHVGPILGVIPTGRVSSFAGMLTVAFRDAKIIEAWLHHDLLRDLSTLGILTGLAPNELSELRPLPSKDREHHFDGAPHNTVWARQWRLSPRHARTAVLLMSGLEQRVIASRLNLSLASVRTYAREIYAKADVHNRTELIVKAAMVRPQPSRKKL